MTSTVGKSKHQQNGILGSESFGITLHINGKSFTVNTSSVPIETSLNTYIRDYAQLHGTKFMCLEGGCGACIVTATGKHPLTKEYRSWAINSCLTPLYACDNLHITTVEGVGNKKDGYHPIQKRLAEFHGTQCGYCSPGMVMNMYSLWEAKSGEVTMNEIENSFGGNICRCTGYRPILDAFKSLAKDADPKLKEFCKSSDIEDLPPRKCPKTGDACNGNCNGTTKSSLHLKFDDGKEWYKVTSLKDIFDIFSVPDTRPYMLVAGNTAHGVYRRSSDIKKFIDVNGVEELHRYTITDSEVILGGNISLTDAMEILGTVSERTGYEYCDQIRKHIDLIANVPVRNAGTIAGNFSIKHSNPEFPSDLLLVMEAVRAEITIAAGTGNSTTMTIKDYLQYDLNKKIILSISLKPLDPKRFQFISYKIMPRAQNAHAYVNAAFLYETQNDLVLSCSVCFGGINPHFLHAEKTEQFLCGKILHSMDTFEAAKTLLGSELTLDWQLPDATPEYRKNLALSLFYKSILATCPEGNLRTEFKTGASILERPISSGIQTFDTYKDKWPMTQPIQKAEGLIQCSGEAQYVNDIPKQPGQLWAAFVHATRTHARIMNIDASKALSLKGVEYFFSAKDIPGNNTFSPKSMMMMVEDEEIFCDKIVKYDKQPVGVILAESFDLANKAAELVNIQYEESGKLVIPTIKEVFEKNAQDRYNECAMKLIPTNTGNDIKKSFKGRFQMAGQSHFSIETQATVCIPIEDGMEVYSATQWVDFVQVAISQCLKIPENSLNMQVRRLGGGYGGKISRSAHVACACAISCKLTNRPIRFVLTLEASTATVGKRHGLISDYEVHVNEQGKIQKLTNNFVQDLGCNLNEEPVFHSMEFFKNCYFWETFKVTPRTVVTDSTSNTWCRAPGTTEGIAMIENIMEHIAREINRDPIDVRLANIPDDNKMKKLLPEFVNSIEFRKRQQEIKTFNEKNRWRKRGIAVVPMHYPQQFFGSFPVIVSIFHTDGTVAITHGGVECGQGINTKVVQVAAKTLNIPLEYIKIKPSINYITANSTVTGGSMTSEAVCYGAMKACETLLERMKPVREEMTNAKWPEITEACHNKLIDLSTTHVYKMTDVKNYSTWGLSSAEVEIDVLTGNFQLRRVDILEDTGESISPYIDVGQVEGAFVMGLGYWLTEYLIYDKTGELLTNRTWNYKVPGAKDIPIDFRVTFLRNSPNELSVLRSKATGEPALCMSIVAVFALRNAIESARKDAGLKGWFNLGAPTTAEHVYLTCGTKPDHLKI